jgi:hypothetical protein
MGRKNNFTSESIILYSPQKNKILNTSKKEGKNGGICSQPNPKKIGHKYT